MKRTGGQDWTADGLGDRLGRPHTSRLDPARSDYAAILDVHRAAMEAGEAGYEDPTSGLFVLTASHLLDQGQCCSRGCRHCPWLSRARSE